MAATLPCDPAMSLEEWKYLWVASGRDDILFFGVLNNLVVEIRFGMENKIFPNLQIL